MHFTRIRTVAALSLCGLITAAVPSPAYIHAAETQAETEEIQTDSTSPEDASAEDDSQVVPEQQLFAVVKDDDVTIYSGDNGNSQVIANGSVGDSFKVSNADTSGWTEGSVGNTTGYLKPGSTVSLVNVGQVADAAMVAREDAAEKEAEAMAAAQAAAEAAAAEAAENANQALRNQVVAFAEQYLGGRYIWGGEDPNVGADCSGFVKYVMAHAAGVSMNRTAIEQAQQGTPITADRLQPGDLLFYTRGSATDAQIGIGHVAIYIGDGKIIHSSNERDGVKISDWDYRTPLKIVNVLG